MSSTASNPVVHVIDDDDEVRHSTAFLLDTAGLRSLAYASAGEFLDAIADGAAGLVVTDIRMPGMDGLALLRRLQAKGIGLPVIVMTGHGDIPLAVEAMKAGAVDFIEKPFDDERLLGAVRNALGLLARDRAEQQRNQEVAALLATLSERERQVLDGLLAGHPNKTIAYDLGISPRTVEIYRAHVMTKMKARSLSELVRMMVHADQKGGLPGSDGSGAPAPPKE